MTRDPHATGSDEVERLLADCLALPDADVSAAIDAACARRPDLSDDLRARFRALADLGLATSTRAAPQLPEYFGEFRLIARLGEGGMGVIYRARQESLGRELALKIVRPELLWFAKTRERFRREAEAVARLDHPGIVPVFQVGEQSGIPYFVMPLLSGGTLADLLAALDGRAPEKLTAADVGDAVRARAARSESPSSASGAAPWDRAGATHVEVVVRLAVQVARTLQHVHERGIVHRDVKPSNVAITTDGRALLLDFGLRATWYDAEQFTASGVLLGTPAYMSPEQIRDPRTANAGSDVWSLGVTLWQLLALDTPFRGDGAHGMKDAILAGRRASLRARNRAVSVDLETVLQKALEPEPRHRYASAAEFADDLEAALDGRPIRARPVTPIGAAIRWMRRHRARSAAIAAFVLLVLGAPTALWIQQSRHAKRLQTTLDQRDAALDAEGAARAAAVRRLRSVERTLDFLEDVFSSAVKAPSQGVAAELGDIVVKAAASATRAFTEEPGIRGRVLLSTGRVLDRLGRDQESRHAMEDAVLAFDEAGPIERVSLAAAETSLALAISRVDSAANARPHAERALALLRAEAQPDQSNLAAALAALAMIEANAGDPASAESRLREAIEIDAKVHGTESADVAIHRANLGTLLMRTGRKDEAAAELRAALAPLRASPEYRVDFVAALNALALLDKSANRLEDARAAFEEALALLTAPGQDAGLDAAVLSLNLAGVLERLGRADEAIDRARAACTTLDRLLEPGAPNRANAHVNLAGMLGRARRFDDAAAELAIAESLVRAMQPAPADLLESVLARQRELAAMRAR